MSEMTWKRNTAGIAAHAQRRKEHKRKGVEDTITTLLREQEPINFNTVAKAACVSDVRDFLERVNAFGVSLDDSLPKGLSHFDFDIDNVLTQNDRVTAILDFGDMECLPLVVCLGYTLWDVLFEKGGSPALVARYLHKYQEVRQLSQGEKEVLREIILFRHYVITTVQIHFGDFSQNDLDKALQQEQELRNLELRF